jgi:hypothetical protein
LAANLTLRLLDRRLAAGQLRAPPLPVCFAHEGKEGWRVVMVARRNAGLEMPGTGSSVRGSAFQIRAGFAVIQNRISVAVRSTRGTTSMAKKKKSKLSKQVTDLEDAVVRLFTGAGPAPAKKKKRKKAKKAKKAKVVVKAKKTAKKTAKKAKKATKSAKRAVKKTARKAKRKATKR